MEERRRKQRIPVDIEIKIPRFAFEHPFPGFKKLLYCDWRCADISGGGMMLEARQKRGREFFDYVRWLLSSFFEKYDGQTKTYYPVIPPRHLKMAIEFKVPHTNYHAVQRGTMVWFRMARRGLYKMGIALHQDL